MKLFLFQMFKIYNRMSLSSFCQRASKTTRKLDELITKNAVHVHECCNTIWSFLSLIITFSTFRKQSLKWIIHVYTFKFLSACVVAVKSRPVRRPLCSYLYLLVFRDHKMSFGEFEN